MVERLLAVYLSAAAAAVVVLAPSEGPQRTESALRAARAQRSRLQAPHQAARTLLVRIHAAAAAADEGIPQAAPVVPAAAALVVLQELQGLQTLAAAAAAVLLAAVLGSS